MGKTSRGMADEQEMRESKEANRFYADPWQLRGWRSYQIKSSLISMRHLKESWCFLGGGGDSKYVTELLFCRLSLLTARTATWYSTAGASLRKKWVIWVQSGATKVLKRPTHARFILTETQVWGLWRNKEQVWAGCSFQDNATKNLYMWCKTKILHGK